MSDHQSRTASDDLYDHEREEPRSGRRRRPVADWGVGDDMFEHMPRNRFSRVAEGPPRDRRFSRAAEADRQEADRQEADRQEADAEAREWDEVPARDDSQREVAEEPIRWTGPHRDDADEDETPRRSAAAAPQEGVPRGRVEDGRRTIVIGKPEDVPSEIAAITAD